MKNLSLTFCLVFAALLGSVGSVSASDLKDPSSLRNNILRFGHYPNQTCGFTLVGEINREKLLEFKMHLYSFRNPKTCELDDNGKPAFIFFKTLTLIASPGGDLNAAVEIIDLVKKYKLVTHVDELVSGAGGCLSSCALIFAAGNKRHYTNPETLDFASNNIIVGIHKPFFAEGSYDYLKSERMLDEVKYALIDIFNENGLDPRFTINMFETTSEDMRFPKITDMLIWRVITSLSLPEFYKSAGMQNHDCKIDASYSDHLNAVERFQGMIGKILAGEKLTRSDGTELSIGLIQEVKNNALGCLNYNFID